MDYDRWDALLHHIFKQTQGDAWFRPAEDNLSSGVAIRVADDPVPEYRVFPYENVSLEPFEAAVKKLGPVVAVKVRSAAVHAAIAEAPPDDTSLYVDANNRIQIIDTMLQLPFADKEQCAAFIRDERVLVVWSNSLDTIIPVCQDFDASLIKLLWRSRPTGTNSSLHSQSFLGAGSVSGHDSASVSVQSQGLLPPAESGRMVETKTVRTWYGRKRTVPVTTSTTGAEPPRKLALYAPIYNGLAAGLALVFIGNGVQVLVREYLLTAPVPDTPNPEPTSMQRYLRFVLAVTLPLLYCVSLFFTLQIMQNVSMAIGPIAHYHRNSRYYSAVPPKAPQSSTEEDKPEVLPHITIQMPVYRESLETVLAPSIASLKRAMQTYARQGGTSSIFVCDDGMRTAGMSKADRDERIRYYRSEGIGWVARPRDGCPTGGLDSIEETLDTLADPEKGFGTKKKKSKSDSSHKGIPTFHRAGRFKKASNMNYGLNLSLCMERHLMALVESRNATAGSNSNANSTSSRGPSNLNPKASTQARPTSSSQHSHSRRISHSYPPPQNGSGRASPRVSHGTYGMYGMQYLNRDGDDMRVGGLSGNGNGNASPVMGAGNAIAAPTPTSGIFPSQTSPLMRSDPLGPGFANATPGTPDPAAAEAYYELGMDPLGDLYGDDSIEDLEEEALEMAIEEMWEESRSAANLPGWKPWAANGKAIRVGEIILLVDSDTIVPEDCLRDAAREMANSPNVAIIQHESDVMQVAHHYFENGIAYFTRRINRCISMACANGEIAPFVGHNAFLRWRAIQDASFTDLTDNSRVTREKMWSENNVSEDFDMALRLLGRGYDIRWATYSNGGFKEGVSLTVDDELNRWQKYAYGCNELLFNPLSQWWRRGPISRQIRRFIWSNAPVHYKISMMAYMFSYYGIAASITIGIINYVLLGFAFPVDGFYMHSFEIWLATTVVFFGSGNVGYTLLEYRLGKRELVSIIWVLGFLFSRSCFWNLPCLPLTCPYIIWCWHLPSQRVSSQLPDFEHHHILMGSASYTELNLELHKHYFLPSFAAPRCNTLPGIASMSHVVPGPTYGIPINIWCGHEILALLHWANSFILLVWWRLVIA
ncbi:putative glycosyltransferase family 2 protein [Lentinula detonsa]|uniref:Glycosyltransferase family 2 protein n=1 Tax=Lentinula detonsa TaxID=2804962 RepID=A0A9W8TUN5_9AGAR|nr:putative glycosyltransferase family 2 protein [Lentinula detonsa]